MSFNESIIFTKENVDLYFRELSKEYKKLGGRKLPVEIILVGGAAIVETYGFRDMTTDIDAILPAVSIMKEAINRIGDKFNLPSGWLNADFVKTESYSPKLVQYSVPYRTFNQVINVRMLSGEYLIAMKLRSGRKYKNDLSDVIGILAEHEKKGNKLSYEDIDRAVNNLYGGWNDFSRDAKTFIRSILSLKSFEGLYEKIRETEIKARADLLLIDEKYPGVVTNISADYIVYSNEKRTGRASVLEQLKNIKAGTSTDNE